MSSKIVKSGGSPIQTIQWQATGVPVPASEHNIFGAPVNEYPPKAETARVQELEARVGMLAREVQQRSQEAFQQGVQHGEAQVRQAMSAQMENALQKLATTIEEISGIRQRCRYEAEEDVVKLSLAIARRILHRELTIDPEALLGLVKAALDKLDARELHQVRVSPEDAPLLHECLGRMGLPRRVEVTADPALGRGSAIFETSRGALDASIETQVAEVQRGLTDLVRHHL